MLNIGKLRVASAGYYLDAVAGTDTDYYTGHGEAAGRWMGSLRHDLGLDGPVEPEAFQRVLAGCHPGNGDVLVSAAGSNARARARGGRRLTLHGPPDALLDVSQVAASLDVSTQAVRQWLRAGDRVWTAVQDATPGATLDTAEQVRSRLAELTASGDAPEAIPGSFLLGRRSDAGNASERSRVRWSIRRDEVTRLAETRKAPEAQAGWDLVFRPPKSYSILWAVGGPRIGGEIARIHHQAVSDALAYLEEAAVRARVTTGTRGQRRRMRAETKGFLVAAFDHRDSRAGDPLLHTHCVAANLTRLPGGRYLTLDPRGLYEHGMAADAVYQATFRHLAEKRLGLASEPVVNGWADVEGVPREVVEHFSKRSMEIAGAVEQAGTDSPAARQAAALATRSPKGERHDEVSLHERWAREAAAVGFDRSAVERCIGRAAGVDIGEASVDALFDRLAGPAGLTERAATFTRADVTRALAGALGGAFDGPGVVVLADAFLASERVVPITEHRPGHRRARVLDRSGRIVADLPNANFTTPEIAALEARLIATATSREIAGPAVDQAVVSKVLAGRPELDGEQRTMARTLCAPGGRIRAAVGYPGAGKTYATEAVVASFEAAGVPTLGCAVTAEAAAELARTTGLANRGLGCDTIARTLLDLDDPEAGGLPPGTVVVVDEASTVSHRDLGRLLDHVERCGGALVLVGDPKQHSAVGPGHFFGWLVEHRGETVPRLTTNQRQRDVTDSDGTVVVSLAEERLANVEYREGRIAEALARRDRDGKVIRAATAGELYDAIAADWFVSWQEGSRDPMIATRNSVRAELNRRGRVLRRAAGELGVDEIVGARGAFAVGDYVVARRNHRKLRSPALPGWYVKNGSRGLVTAVDPGAGTVAVDFEGPNGETCPVALPATYVAVHLEWAYAVTDYGVQGRTLDRGRAVLDDTTRVEGAYVATTRGRSENRVYVVDGSVAEGVDPDVGHARAPEREVSLAAIAEHLTNQESDALVHEIDPFAAEASRLATTHTLAELEHALAQANAALDGTPPPVDRRIAGAEARRDELAAEHRSLVQQLRVGTTADPTADITSDGVGVDPQAASSDREATLASELASVEEGIRRLHARLDELRGLEQERESFLAEHASEVRTRDTLRDAVAAREARVRLAAPSLLPRAVLDALPEPGVDAPLTARRCWRRAVEAVALFRDRTGVSASAPPGPEGGAAPVWALGDRPADPLTAVRWDATVRMLHDAASELGSPTTAPTPEPAPVPTP